jgi:hypothetical protein
MRQRGRSPARDVPHRTLVLRPRPTAQSSVARTCRCQCRRRRAGARERPLTTTRHERGRLLVGCVWSPSLPVPLACDPRSAFGIASPISDNTGDNEAAVGMALGVRGAAVKERAGRTTHRKLGGTASDLRSGSTTGREFEATTSAFDAAWTTNRIDRIAPQIVGAAGRVDRDAGAAAALGPRAAMPPMPRAYWRISTRERNAHGHDAEQTAAIGQRADRIVEAVPLHTTPLADLHLSFVDLLRLRV